MKKRKNFVELKKVDCFLYTLSKKTSTLFELRQNKSKLGSK